jgi:hypothetical protein
MKRATPVQVSKPVLRFALVQHRGPEAFVTRAKLERQLIALEKEAVALKGATHTEHITSIYLAKAIFVRFGWGQC